VAEAILVAYSIVTANLHPNKTIMTMWTLKLPNCILYNCSRLYDRRISGVTHKLHLLKLGDASAGGWLCSAVCGLCLEIGCNLDLPPATARGTALGDKEAC
jgi:hypothetical protein